MVCYAYAWSVMKCIFISMYVPSPYDLYCVGGTLSLTQSINQSINMYVISQPTASRCWSSITLTDPASSVVRGRSIRSDSTGWEATTGSATTCSVSWHWTTARSWELICSYVISAGTMPSTVRSLYSARQPTTGWWLLGTRVTLAMRSVIRVIRILWCSPRMTLTMICILTADGAIGATVQYSPAADSGTITAAAARSTVLVTISTGTSHQLELITSWRHHACGWRARSLHWQSGYLLTHNRND